MIDNPERAEKLYREASALRSQLYEQLRFHVYCSGTYFRRLCRALANADRRAERRQGPYIRTSKEIQDWAASTIEKLDLVGDLATDDNKS